MHQDRKTIGERGVPRPPARRPRSSLITAAVAVTLLGATACTSGAQDSPSGEDETRAEIEVPAYSGPETEFPTSYPTPEPVPGTECTIGLLNPTTAQPGLAAFQASAEETAQELGCEFIGLSADIDTQLQVSQFDQLLDQGADAIILSAVDFTALTPQFERARSLGVPVVGQSVPPTSEAEPNPYLATNVLEGFDQKAYYPIATLAEASPGARFGILGFGFPVPQLDYQVAQMETYASDLGLELLGQSDSAGDTASQYADAATTLLTRYPDLEAIVAFNDSAAEAAVGVVRSDGRDVDVIGVNGDPRAVELVDDGSMLATTRVGYPEIGEQLTHAAYNLITDQNLPLDPVVAVPATPYLGR